MHVQKYVCIYMYRRGCHFKAFQKEIYAIALDIYCIFTKTYH